MEEEERGKEWNKKDKTDWLKRNFKRGEIVQRADG